MEGCVRKCKRVREVAEVDAAEVGVRMTEERTAPQAEATASEAAGKKRKAGGGELEFFSSGVQLGTRRRAVENSSSPATSGNSTTSASIGSDRVLASCCSSNGCLKLLDLEDEIMSVEVGTSLCDSLSRQRRETTPSSDFQAESGEMESPAMPRDQKFSRRTTAEEMPFEAELEEFFSAAEKDLRKQFSQKYNFDFVKEEPLEGRYEWVQVKQ